MKFILFLCLIVPITCFSQERSDPQSIAAMEMQANASQFSSFVGSTAATENFDVKYYRLEWELDPNVRYIKGKVTMYYKMVSPASSLTMDLTPNLTVTNLTQRGTALSFTRPGNTIVINFPGTVSAGTLDSLSVEYQGVPDNTGFGSFIQDSHAGTPVIWSLSEAYGSRDWWPCKNNLDDKADSIDVYITHPTQYKAASNGLLQSITDLGTGKTITHWKHRYPIASYLICMAVTNYAVFNNSVQLGNVNLPMTTYCYPENLATWQTGTQNTLDAIKLFHNTVGEYPFIKEKYGHVQFGWGGGMEHQTSTFVIHVGESLTAHELGHQWFGDKITAGSWEDIWLNEGFATYMAAFYMENKYPETAIANRKIIVDNITSAPGGRVQVDDTTILNHVFNQRLSYNKGSQMLFMLRFILGDDVFWKGMRRYASDPSLVYGHARTADFKRNMEAESGKDLTYFFNQWYSGEGYPSYNVEWSTVGRESVNIKMSQTTSHSSVSFFRSAVALKFKNATQEKTIVVDNTFNGQTFIKTLGFIPDTVLIDPEYWLISKNNKAKQVAPINTGTGEVEIYPNPILDPLTLYFHDFSSTKAEIVVYDRTGRMMYRSIAGLTNGAEFIKIPTSGWAKGVYTIRINSADKTIVKQLMK